MHRSSMDKMRVFRDKYLSRFKDKNLLILDLGSQDVNGSYRELFDIPPWQYKGVDMEDGKNVDIVLKNPYRWNEVETGCADVVISGQAFEHIEYFWLTMLEIRRVLKPMGLCCIIAPSSGPEHHYPVDCWRFLPHGFKALARFANLDVLEVYRQESDTGYDDGSDLWQDCVLVSRKPYKGFVSSLTMAVKYKILQRLLSESL